MASIETDKFKNMVSSIGSDTIQAIATAGPEMQVCNLITYSANTLLNLENWLIFLDTDRRWLVVDHA